jgi:hypothetical protein
MHEIFAAHFHLAFWKIILPEKRQYLNT